MGHLCAKRWLGRVGPVVIVLELVIVTPSSLLSYIIVLGVWLKCCMEVVGVVIAWWRIDSRGHHHHRASRG